MFLFKKVTIDNFRSIGHVELNLENRGLVLVEGINDTNQTYVSNGSGKSTMLSAIPWALYDITPEGAKADDVVNNKVGKNTSVILDFEIDGLPYTIERYRKHKKYKNKVRLLQGDNELTLSTVAETNKKILELFGIDLNTFLNSIMYGQGDVEIFAKATDKGKKAILENVANIAIYQKAQEIAKDKLAETKLKVTACETESETLHHQLGALENQEAIDESNYKKTADLIKHQQSVVTQAEMEYQQLIASQVSVQEQTKEQIEKLDSELATLDDVPTPQSMLDDYNAFSAQITSLKAVYDAKNTEIRTLTNTMNALGTSTKCPACGTELDMTHREEERARIQEQVAGIAESIKPTADALPALEGQLADKKLALDNIYYKINDVNNRKQAIATEKMNLANAEQTLSGNIIHAEGRVTSAKEQLANLQSLPKPEKRTEEKKALKVAIKKVKKEHEQLMVEVDEYDAVASKVFSNKGVRSHVLDLTTPFLNEHTNKYLATLSGSDIQVNLSTQKENKDGTTAESFDLQVLNGSGGTEYKTNSAGERKRIDLAIALAIQDLVFSKSNLATNLVVYDECFDGLDSIGCENVIEILKDKQKTVGSIFVITHNENLKSLFENVVTVRKVDGLTSLVGAEG